MSYKNWPGIVVLMAAVAVVCTSCTTTRMAGRPDGEYGARLAYRESETLGEDVGYVGSTGIMLTNRPRKKPAATPVFLSKRPLYGTIELGEEDNNKHMFILDESRGTGSGYDVLYFDGNNNQDLTDDGQVSGKIEERSRRTVFPLVEAEIARGSETYPHRLKPTLYPYGSPSISFQSAAYRVGDLQLDGERFKMALFDDQTNGVFNDAFRVPEGWPHQGSIRGRYDSIVIDFNKDGKFDKQRDGSNEVFPLGKYMIVAGRCYEVTVQPDGSGLALRASEAPCGRIALQDSGWVDLLSEEGPLKLTGPAELQVPVGDYRIFRCVVAEKDERGEIWRAAGLGEWEQEPVHVGEEGVTELQAGAPLVATVKVEKRSRREFQFALEIRGQGGESYAANKIMHPRSGVTGGTPKFKVTDANGKTIATGKFEYG